MQRQHAKPLYIPSRGKQETGQKSIAIEGHIRYQQVIMYGSSSQKRRSNTNILGCEKDEIEEGSQ